MASTLEQTLVHLHKGEVDYENGCYYHMTLQEIFPDIHIIEDEKWSQVII